MRLLIAAVVVLAYILFTVLVLRFHRRRTAAATRTDSATSLAIEERGPVLIAFASQTGFAEQIALQTAQALERARIPQRTRALANVSLEDLRAAERALFVVSTTGEGDPPDSSLRFVNGVMSAAPALPQLGYALLALGDSTYRNFCGFGRTLDTWLQNQEASPLFERVDVDNADEHAIGRWLTHIGQLTGEGATPVWQAPETHRWQLSHRQQLNPGSEGQPCFQVELAPLEGAMPAWRAGDIAVIYVPNEKPREYSIASLPEDGSLQILVRQSRRADGTLGVASGWLTEQLPIGGELGLRVRPNANFHAPPDEHPMILIGNGTGIAGLRAHLKARERAGIHHNWLIFGERNARFDSFYGEDIERWQKSGVLARTDLVFSRDQPERIYVQHLIRSAQHTLLGWVTNGAWIYICGSAEGMAQGVHSALAKGLGEETLERLTLAGRIRRDVY